MPMSIREAARSSGIDLDVLLGDFDKTLPVRSAWLEGINSLVTNFSEREYDRGLGFSLTLIYRPIEVSDKSVDNSGV